MSSSRNSRAPPGVSAGGYHRPAGGCHHHHTPSHRLTSPFYSYYYYPSSPSSASSAFASTSSFCSSRSPSFPSFPHPHHHHHQIHQPRSTSPSRVNLAPISSPSVRFSIVGKPHPSHHHHHHSPHHNHNYQHRHSPQKRTCMCSPTTHPGSFRCSLHKSVGPPGGYHQSPSHSLSNARRSAMTNSLVRIGTVEGELVKRALSALIRPSSHQQRRRAAFQPRPSRLSVMTCARDGCD